MAKYIQVDISKAKCTALYLRVPDTFMPVDAYRLTQDQLRQAVEETVERYDWSDDDHIDVDSAMLVDETEASQYAIFDLLPKTEG